MSFIRKFNSLSMGGRKNFANRFRFYENYCHELLVYFWETRCRVVSVP